MQERAAQSMSVSVVIPAYNAGRYVARAIHSVLNQTRPADEIIVVDDGSVDNTAEVVRSFSDKVVLIQQANAGVSAARNTGILAAKGDWVAFLDADDEWLPFRLERQFKIIERHPALAWVTGNYLTCISSEDRQAPYLEESRVGILLDNRPTMPNYFQGCVKDLGGHTDTMLIRRHVILEAGLFSTELIKAEDMDLWWRIAYTYPEVGYVSAPLAVYHLGASESLNQTRMNGAFFAGLIHKHLKLSREHHQDGAFRPLASRLLRGWMRSMLFTAQGRDVRFLLKEFGPLFPFGYCGLMRALILFPRLTAAGCRLCSYINHMFHLRRRVVAGSAGLQ
jgi:glycosyltransferase involved in cell wall biosynthesis